MIAQITSRVAAQADGPGVPGEPRPGAIRHAQQQRRRRTALVLAPAPALALPLPLPPRVRADTPNNSGVAALPFHLCASAFESTGVSLKRFSRAGLRHQALVGRGADRHGRVHCCLCLVLPSRCLSTAFHCLSALCCRCLHAEGTALSLVFHCLSLTFPLHFTAFSAAVCLVLPSH